MKYLKLSVYKAIKKSSNKKWKKLILRSIVINMLKIKTQKEKF